MKAIELDNLDEILKTHAYEFQNATKEMPALRKAMTAAKLEIDRVEAALYIAVRSVFEESGEKFTETKILATVKQDKDYIQSHSEWLDAREAYDKVDQLREVFMQREASIKNLVSLYHAQYWSLSSVEVTPQPAPQYGTKTRFKEREK